MRSHFCVALLIAATALAAHGWSLDDGLFLDDHWHQLKLREASWSFADLIDSTTIEPSRWLGMWWQDQEVRWDYSRPLTMAWMKLVHEASVGSVPLQHLSCVTWHLVCCLLIYLLCLRVTANIFWSGFAAILFVVYPHNVYTVGWLASQNAVIQATLTLAALLCYLPRASSRGVAISATPAAVGLAARITADTAVARAAGARADGARAGRFAATIVLFVLSLMARENAVVLPALCMAFDLAMGGRQLLRQRWKAHAVLWTIAVVFSFWRLTAFDSKVPEVYIRRPQDAGYTLWLLAKLLHYVVCVIWEAPMMIGPTRHADPFGSAPWDCLLMIVIAGLLGCGYWLACRKQVRGYWVWPLWILLAILPVLPIMATPHSAYLPGVAFVIAVVLKPAFASARRAPFSTAAAWWMMGMSIFAFVIYRMTLQSIVAAEKYTIAQMTANPPPPPGSHVFVMNLPLVNIYLPVSLQKSWESSAEGYAGGSSRPGIHVLNFSSDLLRGSALRIRKQDEHSFVVSCGDGQPVFDGALGEFLIRAMRRSGVLGEGEIVHSELFDVEVLPAGLEFTFREPLASHSHRFFLITEDCPGAALDFSSVAEDGSPALSCAELPERIRYEQVRDRFPRIIAAARKVIRTQLYLTDRPL